MTDEEHEALCQAPSDSCSAAWTTEMRKAQSDLWTTEMRKAQSDLWTTEMRKAQSD